MTSAEKRVTHTQPESTRSRKPKAREKVKERAKEQFGKMVEKKASGTGAAGVGGPEGDRCCGGLVGGGREEDSHAVHAPGGVLDEQVGAWRSV